MRSLVSIRAVVTVDPALLLRAVEMFEVDRPRSPTAAALVTRPLLGAPDLLAGATGQAACPASRESATTLVTSRSGYARSSRRGM